MPRRRVVRARRFFGGVERAEPQARAPVGVADLSRPAGWVLVCGFWFSVSVRRERVVSQVSERERYRVMRRRGSSRFSFEEKNAELGAFRLATRFGTLRFRLSPKTRKKIRPKRSLVRVTEKSGARFLCFFGGSDAVEGVRAPSPRSLADASVNRGGGLLGLGRGLGLRRGDVRGDSARVRGGGVGQKKHEANPHSEDPGCVP